MGADFNAQVGSPPCSPDVHSRGDAAVAQPRSDICSQCVGPHGVGCENSRGQWLRRWATNERLEIVS
eukprot:2356650-Pyramimonas_sp.AAC.1